MLMESPERPTVRRPRVTPHAWEAGGELGALIDLPGGKGRGMYVPREYLGDVIDALMAIEEGA